jgi:hypothetical protein
MNTSIASKMENIKAIFQRSRESASQLESIPDLISELERTEREFLSVAYEGAAMGLALKDFSNSDDTHSNWFSFLSASKRHAPQVYIGLGWAVAQEKRTGIPALSPNMEFRVWDGCGYFDGIFRQRQTIKGQNRLEYIPEKNYRGYDEGLGRSIWYICKGDETKVPEMIHPFSEERQSDLWRGIGIACSYVGGFEENALMDLMSSAGKHSAQLGIGAAMVAESRIEADCHTNDIELANRIFNSRSADESKKIILKNKEITNFSLSTFVTQMENDLRNH